MTCGVLSIVAEERGSGNVSGEGGFGPWAGFGHGLKTAPGAFSPFSYFFLFFFYFLLIFGLKTFTKPLF
jgi:hypothetical protein